MEHMFNLIIDLLQILRLVITGVHMEIQIHILEKEEQEDLAELFR